MHREVLDWVGQFSTDDDLSVLDIGGRDLNGSPHTLFPNADPYHVLDLRPGLNVDIVANAATWEPNGLYDLVLCTEVFEHTPFWRSILMTAWEALRPGGWFIFTCAGHGRPAHSGIEATPIQPGEYYGNVGPLELTIELRERGWTEIECHQLGTDTQGKAVKPSGPAVVYAGPEVAAAGRPEAQEGSDSASRSEREDPCLFH